MGNLFDNFFEDAHSRFDSSCEQKLNNQHEDSIKIVENDTLLSPLQKQCNIWEAETLLGVSRDFPRLTPDDQRLLDGAIREIGVDALAFYKSKRFISQNPFCGKWGIFYLDQGISRVQEMIMETYPGYGSSHRLAYEFLKRHEHYHFKFDVYALAMEAHLQKPLYQPLKQAFLGNKNEQIEEALANLDAYRWSRQKKIGIGDFAYQFMKLQPGAYARFDEKHTELRAQLAANLLDNKFSATGRRYDQALWVSTIPKELQYDSLCPEWVYRPTEIKNDWYISPALKLPQIMEISETKKFIKSLSQHSSMHERWEATKKKLMENPGLIGLNFKPWPKNKYEWSVRVTDNFRAHLIENSSKRGYWEAIDFGNHKAMGHG